MSLTGISSLESTRRKFFMNSTYIMSRKKESNVFRLRRPKCHQLRRKFSINSTKRFWAQEAEMSITAISSLESIKKIFLDPRIDQKKIFR